MYIYVWILRSYAKSEVKPTFFFNFYPIWSIFEVTAIFEYFEHTFLLEHNNYNASSLNLS